MNGEDEKICSWPLSYTLLVLLFAYLVVTVGWYSTYYQVFISLKRDIKAPEDEIVSKYSFTERMSQSVKSQFTQEYNVENLWELNGDDLAHFKVNNNHRFEFEHAST